MPAVFFAYTTFFTHINHKEVVQMKKKTLIFLAAILVAGSIISFFIYSKNNLSRFYPSDETISAYLKRYGWETKTEDICFSDITIPCKFNKIYSEYNKVQKEQGFDLENYKGSPAILITCPVVNYAGIENVSAQLIISEDYIIGATIVCTGENGFVKPLNRH